MARFLRVGVYAAILALMPAKAMVEQFANTVPRNIHDRRLYFAVSDRSVATPSTGPARSCSWSSWPPM